MVEETVTEVVEKEVEKTFYKCDKCHGRNHEPTSFEEDLNRVIFGAEASSFGPTLVQHNTTNTLNSMPTTNSTSPDIVGEYEYLLCDDCLERAHDYFRDFF